MLGMTPPANRFHNLGGLLFDSWIVSFTTLQGSRQLDGGLYGHLTLQELPQLTILLIKLSELHDSKILVYIH